MPKGSFCKVNVQCPSTGGAKSYQIEDFRKVQQLHGLRISSQFDGSLVDPELVGCTLQITGGNDAQGFPMMQGVLKNQRVRLLLSKGRPCFRERKTAQMRRKSIRGCIVGADLHALNVSLVAFGNTTVEGVTNLHKPAQHLPKRASKLRRLFGIPHSKLAADQHHLVVTLTREVGRTKTSKSGKTYIKTQKIQRLVTKKTFTRRTAKRVAIKAKQAVSKKLLEQFKPSK
ncbi:Ribosomal protein S6 [Spironucleus salmonicida]|uniref:40S ribosomal protein S6 n=1 Tax=Spironucleus salmonicida TaxID=348837 RepID=V6LIB3_9EUKA|nr:40S ribosomal protein S6 [Spironucleus salmonicida]KAH0570957.1 Ribosomal protein S6 [Spironucleus salmonicida]|eukprot:EST44320.1 Ribosomal protein S6 [Spironucleus salmonicida]